jgi:hypothetical protein
LSSSATSNLLDLQVDTVSKFAITKGGQIIGSAGTALLPTYSFFDSNWGTGYVGWFKTADMVACSAAGGTATPFSISHVGLKIQNSIPIGWTSSTGVGTLDTILIRDGAANTLAQRNGVNPQTFRLYNTYTDATTFERLNIKWDSNVLKIGTEKGSTGGVARSMEFQTDGTTRWSISSAGNLLAGVDNTYDIGASGATRPRDIYAGRGILTTGGEMSNFGSNSNFYIQSTGSRSLTFISSTSLYQIGGTTSSYPAIKRNGAALQARLADDSANAALETANLTVVGNISAVGDIAVATSLQGVILVSPNSTRWKITINDDGSLQTTAL